jgi:flagellar protein FliL
MLRSPDTAISRRGLLVFALMLALPAASAWAQEDAKPKSENSLGSNPSDTLNANPYVRFAQIVVPIIEGDKVTKQMGVTLTLQLYDGKSRREVDAKRPLLTDAFVQFLYGYFQQRAGLKTPIDEAVLKERLRQTAARVVGPDMVKEVLIQQFFER